VGSGDQVVDFLAELGGHGAADTALRVDGFTRPKECSATTS